MFFSATPLGVMQTWALELEDHFVVAKQILTHSRRNNKISNDSENQIDYDDLEGKALQEEMKNVTTNPFGIQDKLWTTRFVNRFQAKDAGLGNQAYLNNMRSSMEWRELDLLLKVLKELHVKALFVGRPMNGTYYDALGISRDARQIFYNQFKETVTSRGFSVIDFEEFDGDKYFGTDTAGHTSSEGWVHVNKVLDAFYHNHLEEAGVQVFH